MAWKDWRRFFEKVHIPEDPNGCWEWTGATTKAGYGIFPRPNRSAMAHRVSYSALVGEIPSGAEMDHLCKRKSCVNPRHLEPVSHLENVRRGPHGNKTQQACKHGHVFDEKNTYFYYWHGRLWRNCRRCRVEKARVRRANMTPEELASFRESDAARARARRRKTIVI